MKGNNYLGKTDGFITALMHLLLSSQINTLSLVWKNNPISKQTRSTSGLQLTLAQRLTMRISEDSCALIGIFSKQHPVPHLGKKQFRTPNKKHIIRLPKDCQLQVVSINNELTRSYRSQIFLRIHQSVLQLSKTGVKTLSAAALYIKRVCGQQHITASCQDQLCGTFQTQGPNSLPLHLPPPFLHHL